MSIQTKNKTYEINSNINILFFFVIFNVAIKKQNKINFINDNTPLIDPKKSIEKNDLRNVINSIIKKTNTHSALRKS